MTGSRHGAVDRPGARASAALLLSFVAWSLGPAGARAASATDPAATAPEPGGTAPAEGAASEAPGRGDPMPDVAGHGEGHGAALSDEYVPVQEIERRPRLFIEWGPDFLGPGPLPEGARMPGGAVVQPSVWVWGSFRSALQYRDAGAQDLTEWANRLDLFTQVRFTGTERIVAGVRPLDEDGRFASYTWEPESEEGWDTDVDAQLQTLFFEGDIGEMFPVFNRSGRSPADLGLSVGRQPIAFQDGVLIADDLDAVGLTRNSLQPKGTGNVRLTWLHAWNDIDRVTLDPDAKVVLDDPDAKLWGFFAEVDTHASVLNFDSAWVDGGRDGGDGYFFGFSALQRLGRVASTFRLNTSLSHDTDSVGDGTLALFEFSVVPHGTHDNVYWTLFAAVGEYTSAARSPTAGGPLNRAGILFAAPGIGRYGAPLSGRAADVAGGALGWQKFFADHRRQLILEVAARNDLDDSNAAEAGIGVRFQQAFRQHYVLVVDAYFAALEDREDAHGVRVELLTKF